MFAEAAVLIVAVAAAIGTVAKLLKRPVFPTRQISAVVVMALFLVGIFLLVWQT
jgi:cell division protein FtsX